MRSAMLPVALLVLAGCRETPKTAPTHPAGPDKPTAPEPARITHFYISPAAIEAGQEAFLCYGVENARSVRLQPPVEALRPAYSRCIQVSPRRDTRYTLIAEGADGREVSLSAEVKVQAAAPADRVSAPPSSLPPLPSVILEFVPSASRIRAGQPVTLCYQVAPDASVRLDPDVERPPGPKSCFTVTPHETTTYTLTATDAKGRSETQRLTITLH